MLQMEQGTPIYMRYFEDKWRKSLQRKRRLFPEQHDFDDATLKLHMRELTEWLVQRHTDFGTLDNYFDGYSIAGERLAPLAVPTDILMSADRSEEHTSELQSLMRISYAVFCLKKKKTTNNYSHQPTT